jgi:hypothetical protein
MPDALPQPKNDAVFPHGGRRLQLWRIEVDSCVEIIRSLPLLTSRGTKASSWRTIRKYSYIGEHHSLSSLFTQQTKQLQNAGLLLNPPHRAQLQPQPPEGFAFPAASRPRAPLVPGRIMRQKTELVIEPLSRLTSDCLQVRYSKLMDRGNKEWE